MANHEFGLMPEPPKPGQRFDVYEPEKYDCVAVSMDWMDELLPLLRDFPCFWHSVDTPGWCLDESGVNLLPPEACAKLLPLMNGQPQLEALLRHAVREGKWVIHFGL